MSELISDSANDLISRQAAIDEFTKQYNDAVKETRHDARIERIHHAIVTILYQLPSAQPAEWTPCEVEQPKHVGLYIVTCRRFETNGEPSEDFGATSAYWNGERWRLEGVVAWQPMPAPWKGAK